MKPLLHPCSIFMFLFTLIISTNMPTSLGADSNGYSKCNNTFSCGSVTSLTYPFWDGDERPQYCGEPNLEIKCDGEVPKFTVDSVTYRILAWDIKTENLTVARDDYWSGNICLSEYKNDTLYDTVFRYDDEFNVTLLYNCNGTLRNPFVPQSCGYGTIVYYAAQVLPYESCTSVVIPISEAEAKAVVDNPSLATVRDALQGGFGLKWNSSDECSTCVESGGACGNNDGQFICFCKDGSHETLCTSDSGSSSKWHWRLKTVIGASAAGVGVVVFAMIICNRKGYFTLAQRRLIFKKTGTFTDHNIEDCIKSYGFLAPKRYSYLEVKRITNSFCEQLGQGGYGVVYKGSLPGGRHAAVKVINESKGSGEEFLNEVASISRTSHVNIVSLLGFCTETNKRALIYEFMINGSLDKFIYKSGSLTTICNLDWNTLYQIAIGIARELEYLHRGCGTRIIHLDIKPQNILLDEDFCPKISDFGLAKICQKKESIVSILGTRGTIGYIAPEVFSRIFGGVSHKSDVYSYGMLILEIVGGRKNYESGGLNTSEMYFPDWIYKDLEQGNIPSHMYPLVMEEENEIVKKITLVSLWCIQTNPSDRPSISKVVEMLEGPLESLPFPPKPFLYSPARPPLQISSISSSNMDEANSIITLKDVSVKSNELAKMERL